MPESSRRAHGGRNATCSSTLSRPTKGSTSISTIGDDEHSDNNRHGGRLAWGNTRRREKFAPSETSMGPILKIGIPQIQGAMVTGYYGVGFNPWLEEDRWGASETIKKIWKKMAQNQHMKGRNRAYLINMEPKVEEARKVLFESTPENKTPTNTHTDV